MNDSIPPDHFIQGQDTDDGRNQINQGEYRQLNIGWAIKMTRFWNVRDWPLGAQNSMKLCTRYFQ